MSETNEVVQAEQPVRRSGPRGKAEKKNMSKQRTSKNYCSTCGLKVRSKEGHENGTHHANHKG